MPNAPINNETSLIETVSTASTDTIDTLESTESFNSIPIIFKMPADAPLPSPKKSKIIKVDFIDSAFSEGLETLLQKTTEGRILLAARHKLTNDQRQKLANICIGELINIYGKDLNSGTILKAAQEIPHVFILESSDVYMISNQEGGPKGKLWHRYHNIRKAIKLADSHRITENKENEDQYENPFETIGTRDETSKLLDFLKVAIAEAWEATFKMRGSLYAKKSILDVFRDFPCLRLDSGIQLLEIDFNLRYGDRIDVVYSTFPKVRNAILDEAKEIKIKLDTHYEDPNLNAIISLVYLFPPITLKKSRKGGNWRPTRSEIFDSFFMLVDTFDEFQERLSMRRAKLSEHNLTMQPFAVVIGGSNFFIQIENQSFKVDSALRTLELTFKMFYALDLGYPCESEHIWLLIEEILFNMKPKKKHPSSASIIHRYTENTLIVCGQHECNRNFPSINSSRKHLKYHEKVGNVKHSKTTIERFKPNEKEPMVQNVSNNQAKDYLKNNLILDDNINHDVNISETNSTLFQTFSDKLVENIVRFLSNLYISGSIPRKSIQDVIMGVQNLLVEPLTIFEIFVQNTLDITNAEKVQVKRYFQELHTLFNNLDSEYLRFKFLQKRSLFIVPTEIVVGQSLEFSQKNNSTRKNYMAQFVPISLALEKLFSLPNIYKDTVNYINELQKESKVYNNVQTLFWKEKCRYFDNNNVFPLLIYFDEFEIGNPLGSHAGIHKFGAIYYSIPCIPPVFQSSLENIFIAMLFHSSDLKRFGEHILFTKLVDELNSLENNGIVIKLPEERKVYFCVTLILGDNLGVNTVLGFQQRFTSNFFCRFCKTSRCDTQTLCYEVTSSL
ncbi:unnamed protein product [Ceutorhynchus assimilis]|uniref:C2H2-type domain-containing protein n=1 Tax=Ceutorhynchus assimilis TaxID=467358 RepID=A0A9N9QBJ1_9CUCU|nr:unnamed protein product [Ceutorhynchus assimilis]